jgi:ATP-dependent protease ClpP protease subunit
MSAATMIFLASESFEVSDHSAFMFHNYSGISIGKGGEMYEQISFEKKWFNKLVNNIYKDFLTSEEIKDIEQGKDLWLDGDEVVLRLKKMGKFEVKQQLELDLDEENEE